MALRILAFCCLCVLPLIAGNARHTTVHRLTGAIKVDGLLNDPAWLDMPTIGSLVQAEPDSGAAPTEQTEVRVGFDSDALYIAVRCLDNQADDILATHMSRDARLFSDDSVAILLDTFNDGRNAFFFQTNPLGALVDGRITENGREDTNWDGIWNVRARMHDDGWTAEFQIPFKTLSFQPGGGAWGFNVERQVARLRERERWASPSLDVQFFQVASAGAIDGLEGLSQGVGLDIKPYALGGYARDIEADKKSRILRNGGLDVFYRITSNLTSSTTVNTDFAETEVDARQVNLTRFDVFFPEKRAFFLEDAGIFSFGIVPRALRGPPPDPDSLAFFSRTIGLVDEQQVPVRVGEKLTGKVGRFDVGLLDVVTGETDTLSRQNLFVGRTKANFWSQSYVGALVTSGDPSGLTGNSLGGVDLKLSTADFLKTGKNAEVTLFGAKTWTPGIDSQDSSFGFNLSYPNDLVSAELEWQQIGQNYRPALGYVNRQGVRKTSMRMGLNPRPEVWNIRQLRFQVGFTRYHNLPHRADETRLMMITPLEIEFNSGSRLEYRIKPDFERLFEPFEIHEGVSIPTGAYNFTSHELSYFSASNRPWQVRLHYEFGSFYTGTSRQSRTEFRWRNEHLSTSVEFEQYRVKLREGAFTTRLAIGRIDYSFTPLITLSNFVQYDTDSQNIGLQSRLRWILQPGNEIYLVLNHSWQENTLDRFESLRTDVRAKLNYTFRF